MNKKKRIIILLACALVTLFLANFLVHRPAQPLPQKDEAAIVAFLDFTEKRSWKLIEVARIESKDVDLGLISKKWAKKPSHLTVDSNPKPETFSGVGEIKKSGRFYVLITISVVTPREAEAKVAINWYSSPMGMEWWLYNLRKDRGQWKVVSAVLQAAT